MLNIYLRYDDQLPSLCIDHLDHSCDCYVTDSNAPDMAQSINSGHVFIRDWEKDIGLRLRATLRCYLEIHKQEKPYFS